MIKRIIVGCSLKFLCTLSNYWRANRFLQFMDTGHHQKLKNQKDFCFTSKTISFFTSPLIHLQDASCLSTCCTLPSSVSTKKLKQKKVHSLLPPPNRNFLNELSPIPTRRVVNNWRWSPVPAHRHFLFVNLWHDDADIPSKLSARVYLICTVLSVDANNWDDWDFFAYPAEF